MSTTTQSTMIYCVCGKRCRVPAELLEHPSRRAKCSACEAILNLPEKTPVITFAEVPGHKTTVVSADFVPPRESVRTVRVQRSVTSQPSPLPAPEVQVKSSMSPVRPRIVGLNKWMVLVIGLLFLPVLYHLGALASPTLKPIIGEAREEAAEVEVPVRQSAQDVPWQLDPVMSDVMGHDDEQVTKQGPRAGTKVMEISIADLLAARANDLAWDETYQGKWVKVCGKLTRRTDNGHWFLEDVKQGWDVKLPCHGLLNTMSFAGNEANGVEVAIYGMAKKSQFGRSCELRNCRPTVSRDEMRALIQAQP